MAFTPSQSGQSPAAADPSFDPTFEAQYMPKTITATTVTMGYWKAKEYLPDGLPSGKMYWDTEEKKLYWQTDAGLMIPIDTSDKPRRQGALFHDDRPACNWCYKVEYRSKKWIVGLTEDTWTKWDSWTGRYRFRRKKAAEAFMRRISSEGRWADRSAFEFRVIPDYIGKTWREYLKPEMNARRCQREARLIQRYRDRGEFAKANELANKVAEEERLRKRGWGQGQMQAAATQYYSKTALETLGAMVGKHVPPKDKITFVMHPLEVKALEEDLKQFIEPSPEVVEPLSPEMSEMLEKAAKAHADQMAASIEKALKDSGATAYTTVTTVHDESVGYIVELPKKG